MKYIDMHCDTLGKLLYGEMTQGRKIKPGQTDTDPAGSSLEETDEQEVSAKNVAALSGPDLMHNDFAVSIPAMRKADTLAQFFACFTYVEAVKGGYEECYQHALKMIGILKEQCRKYPQDLAQAISLEDILRHETENKISAVVTVEEGGILCGKMERLQELYDCGVRLITPIWNFENCFGAPNSTDPALMQKGLKPFGKEAIGFAGELGMIADVSHASDGSFKDILACATGPVIASHSNCRALCRHPRNLTDRMIRKLADRGGAAGLNFYGHFLNGSGQSRMEDMVRHIKHMIKVGGEDFPMLGTDFDGFDGMTHEDIPTAGSMERLWESLLKAGLTGRQLEKLQRKNAERILSAADFH